MFNLGRAREGLRGVTGTGCVSQGMGKRSWSGCGVIGKGWRDAQRFSVAIPAESLSDPTEIPPTRIARHLSHDPCRTIIFEVSQTIAATPPLLSIKMAEKIAVAKTDLRRRVSNHLANRVTVAH